jgi:hypothetical protein
MPIVNLLEIISFKSLGFGLLAVSAHLSFLAFSPFIECGKELVLMHQ